MRAEQDSLCHSKHQKWNSKKFSNWR